MSYPRICSHGTVLPCRLRPGEAGRLQNYARITHYPARIFIFPIDFLPIPVYFHAILETSFTVCFNPMMQDRSTWE